MAAMEQSADAILQAQADPAPIASRPPELEEADYLTEVLRIPQHKSESWLEDELEARAASFGLSISRPPTPAARNTFSTQSASTVTTSTQLGRNSSTASRRSTSTSITNYSSLASPQILKRTLPEPEAKAVVQDEVLSFAPYDDFLSQHARDSSQSKVYRASLPANVSTQSLSSTQSRRNRFSISSSFRRSVRWRKSTLSLEQSRMCTRCNQDLSKSSILHTMPCGHYLCTACLRNVVQQSTRDEDMMPPQCCTKPIPSCSIQELLDRETQEAFLRAVVLSITPKSSRVFCPDPSCGEFIPPSAVVDPKHPTKAVCHKCLAPLCTMCKGDAHPYSWICPDDSELSGEPRTESPKKAGWRRCYNCRQLVKPTSERTHMVCECEAQFCSACGGVWDATVGCPSSCNSEQQLDGLRVEDEEASNVLEATETVHQTMAEDSETKRAAEERTRAHPDFQIVQQAQDDELDRFQQFVIRTKDNLRSRNVEQQRNIVDKYAELEAIMNERHILAVNHLEDRQISAEMELRTTLEQSERSIRIRLKHMEAYCDGLGQSPDSELPPRIVTERNLRELGQQYNIRDGMEHLHQSRINVMRDRQAKRMVELLAKQEDELEGLKDQQQRDLESLDSQLAFEESAIDTTFRARQWRMNRRWEMMIRILCKELEEKDGMEYAFVPPPKWPDERQLMAYASLEKPSQPTR